MRLDWDSAIRRIPASFTPGTIPLGPPNAGPVRLEWAREVLSMTNSIPLSRRGERALRVASVALLAALSGCDFEPLSTHSLDYSMAQANGVKLTRTWADIAPGAEAQVLGAVEMLVGSPSAPRFLLTEAMVEDGWDPNLPANPDVGELGEDVVQTIQDDNRMRRFEDQLRLIQADRYAEIPEPLYAQDLWAVWQAEYLPALLEDPAAPYDPDDPEYGTWKERAVALFIEHYPSLRESAHMYRVQCLHCHGTAGGGDGPTGEYLSPRPRDYRQGKFKWIDVDRNQRPRREDLYSILHDGVYRTAMPSFARFSRGELEGLIDYVRMLAIRGEVESLMVNDIINSDYGDLPVGSAVENYGLVWDRWLSGPGTYKYVAGEVPHLDEITPEDLALGDELFHGEVAACSTCHGDFGRGDGVSSSEEIDIDGVLVKRKKLDEWGEFLETSMGDKGALSGDEAEPYASNPRNLQLGNYRGGGRPVDIYRRIKYGISGTIMPAASSELTDKDIWALVYYVRSLGEAKDPARIQEAQRHNHGEGESSHESLDDSGSENGEGH